MQTAHKIELAPNNKQRTYFKKACGTARFAWNWGLAEWNRRWKEEGLSSTGAELKKMFNAIKKKEYSWVYDVTKYAAQQPFLELDKAWKKFFKGLAGKPKFKKKGRSLDSFYIGGDQVTVRGKYIKIPNLGWVKMRERVRFAGKINSATVSRTADRWFVSVQVDVQASDLPCKNQASAGMDLGARKLITLSDGTAVRAPKPLKRKSKRLKRMSRSLSRKQHPRKRGDTTTPSKNYLKQRERIARLHMKIANTRRDALHKITTWLTDNYRTIGIEDLNVKGMLANGRLAREIADLGLHELKRQLKYKAKRKECDLVVFDRFYPSSKTCSRCGAINEELGSKEMYRCKACGLTIDRDLNAAINLDPRKEEKHVPGAPRELTPVEIAALSRRAGPGRATSIDEAGTRRQSLSMDRFA